MSLTRLTRCAAVTGALAAPLAFVAPASASTGTSSAYGIAAAGLVNIAPVPSVTSTARPRHKQVVDLLPNESLLRLRVLNVSAHRGHSHADVSDLRIGGGPEITRRLDLVKKLDAPLLSADLISATCKNGRGSAELVNVRINGQRIRAKATPNNTITVSAGTLGNVAVTLNKQVPGAGGSLTVTALELKVALTGGHFQTLSISSATCAAGSGAPSTPPGGPTGGPTTGPQPSPTSSTPSSEAPKPTPVPSNLPVTG